MVVYNVKKINYILTKYFAYKFLYIRISVGIINIDVYSKTLNANQGLACHL